MGWGSGSISGGIAGGNNQIGLAHESLPNGGVVHCVRPCGSLVFRRPRAPVARTPSNSLCPVGSLMRACRASTAVWNRECPGSASPDRRHRLSHQVMVAVCAKSVVTEFASRG